MKFLILLLLVASAGSAELAVKPVSANPLAGDWRFIEMRRLPATEARQGVANDREHLYVISNHALGKYRKDTGERVGAWSCPVGAPLIHLNAGIVHEGVLYCAHSNFPGVPMISSVEQWDTATMQHRATHSFGRTDGSLTWIDRTPRGWIACFVHYGREGGELGRGPAWTRLVEFDREWKQLGGWVFPPALIAQLGVHGFSVSGGALGPGGYLYVTGHDDRALFVLAFPEAGSVLKWVATIPISAPGQGFSWDQHTPNVIYTLSKQASEVIVGQVMNSKLPSEVPLQR
jgi:hypothetical protein